MNTSTITRIFNKAAKEIKNSNESVGFCRMFVLPAKIQTKIAFAIELKTGFCPVNDGVKNKTYFKQMLESMTDQEYKNWLTINL